jgi:hypothetical protein
MKYEKLPDLCFRCGIIGHSVSNCEAERKFLRNEYGALFLAFGNWLKSDSADSPLGIYKKSPNIGSVKQVTQNLLEVESKGGAELDNVVDCVSPLHAESAKCQGQGSVDASTCEKEVASFAHLLARSLKGGPCSSTLVSPLKINSVSPEGTVISPLNSDLAFSGPYKDDCKAQLHLSPDIKSKSTILPYGPKTSTLHTGSHLIGPNSSFQNHTFIHTDPIPSPNPQPHQLEPNPFLEPILHPYHP